MMLFLFVHFACTLRFINFGSGCFQGEFKLTCSWAYWSFDTFGVLSHVTVVHDVGFYELKLHSVYHTLSEG